MRLTDQVALITGSGHGIGRAIACAFASEGARVVVADIDAEAAAATTRAIISSGGKSVAIPTDVTSPESQGRLFARMRKEFDRLDILVNNAGVFHVAPLLDFRWTPGDASSPSTWMGRCSPRSAPGA